MTATGLMPLDIDLVLVVGLMVQALQVELYLHLGGGGEVLAAPR